MQFGEDHIKGYVGRCPYNLRPVEAEYGGGILATQVMARGTPMTISLLGIRALNQMPAATQAAILPLMLPCMTEKAFENTGHEKIPSLGFGGRPGAVPAGTLRFGDSSFRYCGARSY